MKNALMSLILLVTLASAEEVGYIEGLKILTDDVKVLNTTAMKSIDKIANSDTALEEYSVKVEQYAAEVGKLLADANNQFANKDDALVAMDKIENISSQSIVLAKTVAYLSSHQGDNMSDSYAKTLDSTSKTILRLSDDIGVMADRILDMADKIGIMADRIVKTQEIQFVNLNASTKLVMMAMNISVSEMQSMRFSGMKMNTSIQTGLVQSMGQSNSLGASSGAMSSSIR